MYIVLLIINSRVSNTYVYNVYAHTVQQNKAYARAARLNIPSQIELMQCSRLAWYRTRIGRVQYSINAFITAFDFEKLC